MSILNDYIIDYELAQKFELNELVESKILPLQKFDLYTLFAVSDISNVSYLNINYPTPIKTITVNQNDILFYLDL